MLILGIFFSNLNRRNADQRKWLNLEGKKGAGNGPIIDTLKLKQSISLIKATDHLSVIEMPFGEQYGHFFLDIIVMEATAKVGIMVILRLKVVHFSSPFLEKRVQ